MKLYRTLPALLLVHLASGAFAQAPGDGPEKARHLQAEWAKINYQVAEGERAEAMSELMAGCDATGADLPAVETVIWCGIVRASYAGLASPFSAMKYAKAARKDFEKAIDTDGRALAGAAYTSLGTLYYKVPGWPVGFGSDVEAERNLLKGLEFNPDGIDSNYFYGEFLYEQGDFARSRKRLVQAQNAAPRTGRPIADEGRQREIAALLAKVEKKLGR